MGCGDHTETIFYVLGGHCVRNIQREGSAQSVAITRVVSVWSPVKYMPLRRVDLSLLSFILEIQNQ